MLVTLSCHLIFIIDRTCLMPLIHRPCLSPVQYVGQYDCSVVSLLLLWTHCGDSRVFLEGARMTCWPLIFSFVALLQCDRLLLLHHFCLLYYIHRKNGDHKINIIYHSKLSVCTIDKNILFKDNQSSQTSFLDTHMLNRYP